MRLFKEEENVQRAKFYPRIIPLTNFLTNVSLTIYFANKISWTNACFKCHAATPDGYYYWKCLMVNSSGGCCSTAYQNKLLYIQLYGIKQQSWRNKSAQKKLLLLFSKKKKAKQNKKPKQVKALATPVCKQTNKNKRTGKGVGTILFPVHVTFFQLWSTR